MNTKKYSNLVNRSLVAMALSASAFSAIAAPAIYATPGTENLVEYTFTAATSGDIVAYFAGKGEADYTNTLRVYINGVDTGFSGLVNQTSAYGDSLNFGPANAGDSVVFKIYVADSERTWSSNKNQNSDGVNHVYSAAFAGDQFIPVGTYVAFEDLAADNDPLIDFDYVDEQFVVTNLVRPGPTEVPLPATAWLLGSGLLGLVGAARRRS